MQLRWSCIGYPFTQPLSPPAEEPEGAIDWAEAAQESRDLGALYAEKAEAQQRLDEKLENEPAVLVEYYVDDGGDLHPRALSRSAPGVYYFDQTLTGFYASGSVAQMEALGTGLDVYGRYGGAVAFGLIGGPAGAFAGALSEGAGSVADSATHGDVAVGTVVRIATGSILTGPIEGGLALAGRTGAVARAAEAELSVAVRCDAPRLPVPPSASSMRTPRRK